MPPSQLHFQEASRLQVVDGVSDVLLFQPKIFGKVEICDRRENAFSGEIPYRCEDDFLVAGEIGPGRNVSGDNDEAKRFTFIGHGLFLSLFVSLELLLGGSTQPFGH